MSRRATPDPRRSYDRGAWSEDGDDVVDENGEPGHAAPPDGETDLSKLSTAEIVAELRRRESRLGRLVERRQRLAAQLAAIEREIRTLEDEAPLPPAQVSRRPGRTRIALPRPRNSLSLADALAAEVEPDETVRPADVARRVLRNGYQTTAKNFPLLVNGTLRKDERFERVGRGAYRRLTSEEVQARRD